MSLLKQCGYILNITFISTSFRIMWKREPLVSFSVLFRNVCKYILYLETIYAYCVYPVKLNSPKQLPICVKRAETSVVVIVFDGILYEVRAYNAIYPFLSLINTYHEPERARVTVLNASFNIFWLSVLLVEQTGVPNVNHWQTLSHNVVSSKHSYARDSNSQVFMW
jgi:hypothetical protein